MFRNPYEMEGERLLVNFFKWLLLRKNRSSVKDRLKHIPIVDPDLSLLTTPGLCPQLLWIGHSSILLQYKGVNILIDPIFGSRASPISFIGPKRFTEPALAISKLPRIDVVLISHNHYDHLDLPTVKAIGNTPLWIVPLRLKPWFESIGISNVVELDWYHSHAVNEHLTVTAAPAHHWSKRGLHDSYKTLWCSFSIDFGNFRFWFGGDTAYNHKQFLEIGERLGPFDASAIPIGGYDPRWAMRSSHIDPFEAVQIHKEIRSRWSFGIHWGAFVLTDEPIDEPPLLLAKAVEQEGLSSREFETLAIGEIRQFPNIHP